MMPTDELLTQLIGSSARLVTPELEAQTDLTGANGTWDRSGTRSETRQGILRNRVETALDDQLKERTAHEVMILLLGGVSLGLLQEIAGSDIAKIRVNGSCAGRPPWVTGVDKTMLEVRVETEWIRDPDVRRTTGRVFSMEYCSLTEQQSVDVKISTALRWLRRKAWSYPQRLLFSSQNHRAWMRTTCRYGHR